MFIAESNNKVICDTRSKLVSVLMCFFGKVFFFYVIKQQLHVNTYTNVIVTTKHWTVCIVIVNKARDDLVVTQNNLLSKVW